MTNSALLHRRVQLLQKLGDDHPHDRYGLILMHAGVDAPVVERAEHDHIVPGELRPLSIRCRRLQLRQLLRDDATSPCCRCQRLLLPLLQERSMKRLAFTLVILLLGILPAAAQRSTEPVSDTELDVMVRGALEWITLNTEYATVDPPDIVFVDQAEAAKAEDYFKGKGGWTAWFRGAGYEFVGLYDLTTKTVYIPDDWFGHKPGDWGVLVHELVHYVQDEADKKFECAEDQELEAGILSANFVNDRFGNHWPDVVPELRAERKKQTTCTPQITSDIAN